MADKKCYVCRNRIVKKKSFWFNLGFVDVSFTACSSHHKKEVWEKYLKNDHEKWMRIKKKKEIENIKFLSLSIQQLQLMIAEISRKHSILGIEEQRLVDRITEIKANGR